MTTTQSELGISIARLKKDLKDASRLMSANEVRYLIDGYYLIQDHRKAVRNQIHSLSANKEPTYLLEWLAEQAETLESQVRNALKNWTESSPIGQWSQSIVGIGPVISAGLLAHIDMNKATTVGKIWRFAGLDPSSRWEKGKKRPWNADLKVLCWKIGESFVRQGDKEDNIYFKLYAERKQLEISRNESGDYTEQAKLILSNKNWRKDSIAKAHYEIGKLPPAHIHARAKRYAVKMFLSHWHHVAYTIHYKKDPPIPYAIAFLGHSHVVPVPNWPM